MEHNTTVLLQMTQLKLVYGNAQPILGLLLIILQEHVFLNVQLITMIATHKIILVNVWQIVLIGEPLLKILPHFVLVFVLKIHLLIEAQWDVCKDALLVLLLIIQHGNAKLHVHQIQLCMGIQPQEYAWLIALTICTVMIHLDCVNLHVHLPHQYIIRMSLQENVF